MRILYVTDGVAPYVIGGMQTVSRRQIEWLAEAGHEVFAVVPECPNVPQGALPATLVPIPWRKRTLWDAFNPWRYVQDLQAYGRAVADLAEKLRLDVVYSEGPLVDALLEHPKDERVPVVFHSHGMETFQDNGAWIRNMKLMPLRGIMSRHARRADFVISQGGKLDRLLVDHIGAMPDRLRRLPNTAPIEMAGDRDGTHRSVHNRFLFVGRNDPRKGLPLLLRAFANLGAGSLDIVGPSKLPTTNLANVTLHGEIRAAEALGRFYRGGDFLVVPSFAEGMPTVILEAFAQGLPVIASDVGAVGIAVIDGLTGFLVQPGNVCGLTGAMRKAMALGDDEYRRMSAACRTAMEAKFSPDRVWSTLLEILGEAAALGKSRRGGT